MKTQFFLLLEKVTLFYCLFFCHFLLAQSSTVEGEVRDRTPGKYRDFIVCGDRLFAISDSGQFVVWDLPSADTLSFGTRFPDELATALGRDRKGNLYLGTNLGGIYLVDTLGLTARLLRNVQYYVHAIHFDTFGKPILVVPYVVYDPDSKRYWYKFRHPKIMINRRKRVLGLFWVQQKRYFVWPELTYFDDLDRIWMTRHYGEFGSVLQRFNTRKRKIIDSPLPGLNMNLFFPQSLFGDGKGNTYLTSGLQHFGNSGHIYRVDSRDSLTCLFDGSKDWKPETDSLNQFRGLFVGPGTFNKAQNSICFYTNLGFFTAGLTPVGALQPIRFWFEPRLKWERASLAIGRVMAVQQLVITPDQKLIFRTRNNGIGVYHGGKLQFLK
jgi:hypothetical protein